VFEGVEEFVVEDVDADEGPVAEGLLGLLYESVDGPVFSGGWACVFFEWFIKVLKALEVRN
jgi:hypothetical protein